MASGGQLRNAAYSEPPRKRTLGATYTLESDLSSIASSQKMEDRPNNWDFSNWRPSNAYDPTKRPKRGNQEWSQERERERSRESLDHPTGLQQVNQAPMQNGILDLPGGRRHTPQSYPRTKAVSRAEKQSLMNIRKHMTFSDADEIAGGDAERNNERYIPQRKERHLAQQDAVNDIRGASGATPSRHPGPAGSSVLVRNSNIANDEGPDSNQVVGRLMQIRDYIKQASNMMESLRKSGDPDDESRAKQLEQVVSRLKDQENKDLDLLLDISNDLQQLSKIRNLVGDLQEQENSYIGVLQNMVSREDDQYIRLNSNATDMGTAGDDLPDESEAESVDIEGIDNDDDARSVMTDDTTDGAYAGEWDDMQDPSKDRPTIESKLGRHSDTEAEELPSARSSSSKTNETSVLNGKTPTMAEAKELASRKGLLEADLLKKNDELDALRQQHELLKKMLYQQEQLRALQGRQAALLALQRDAEKNIEQQQGDTASETMESDMRTGDETEDDGSVAVKTRADVPAQTDFSAMQQLMAGMGADLPNELRELSQRMGFQRNEASQQATSEDQNSRPNSQTSGVADSEMSLLSMERHQLASKLSNLQQKKQDMDRLLSELQLLRRNRDQTRGQLQDMDAASMTSSQGHIMQSLAANADATDTAASALNVLDVLETRKKALKINEVKKRLDQLRDLVQYYQSSGVNLPLPGSAAPPGGQSVTAEGTVSTNQVNAADGDSVTTMSDFDTTVLMGRFSDRSNKRTNVMSKLVQYGEGTLSQASESQQEAASEVTDSEADNTDTESHLSSNIAELENDPDIQDKVKKLRDAKDKLRRLQELVSLVQQSPDMFPDLPDDLAELAASLDDNLSLCSEPVAAHMVPTSSKRKADKSKRAANKTSISSDTSSILAAQQMYANQAAMIAGQQGAALNPPSLNDIGYDTKAREDVLASTMAEHQEELDSLVQERKKLLGIKNQLNKLYQQLPVNTSKQVESRDQNQQTSPMLQLRGPEEVDDGDTSATESQDIEGPPTARHIPAPTAANPNPQPIPVRQGQENMQVTFKEPLERRNTNASSYDELYGRMRQQRMLREELRDKKKELEFMMRKDKPRRQYFRNQDNQSDNISFSNKSDPFGTQSGDITMATWGGSTADNLESIEEDENDSGDGQEVDDDVDDGYPSDGILQVEEEEEAVGSEDEHNTYTIEDTYLMKKAARDRMRDLRPRSAVRRGLRATGAAPLLDQHQHAANTYGYFNPENRQGQGQAIKRKVQRKQEHNVCPAELLMNGIESETMQEIYELKQEMAEMKAQMHSNQNMSNDGTYTLAMNPTVSPGDQLLMQMTSREQDITERIRRLENIIIHTAIPSSVGDPYMNPYVQQQQTRAPAPHQYLQSPAMYSNLSSPAMWGPQVPQNAYNYAAQDASMYNQAYIPRVDQDDVARQYNGYMASSDVSSYSTADRVRISQGYAPIEVKANAGARPKSQPPSRRPGNAPANWILRERQPELTESVQPEVIPIQTIQANDQRVPKLNLDEIVKARKRHKQRQNQLREESTSAASSNNNNEAVIGRRFPTPSRANAASRLASLQHQQQMAELQRNELYRPGLSAGISGTTAGLDNASVSSYVSSIPAVGVGDADSTLTEDRVQQAHQKVRGENINGESDTTEFSMFEALRDTIYSEVATLISQNEMRPHFLIELFRELQLLSSDYLRQRALYSIQDLITKQLTDDNVKMPVSALSQTALFAGHPQIQKEYQRRLKQSQKETVAPDNSTTATSAQSESVHVRRHKPNGATFDYTESVDTASTMSTPNSNLVLNESTPFASASLGDTVIHLDKALERMRDYERRLAEDSDTPSKTGGREPNFVASPGRMGGGLIRTNSGHISGSLAAARQAAVDAAAAAGFKMGDTESIASSLAQDVISESSVSDFPYPRINTAQLDTQIKSIMKEIIPVLKEHMDDICSQPLLLYLRRLVLNLTRQPIDDNQMEFVRFFQKQLGSILQDSLSKFEGRKMRECGEELLVELSEILFNELAFFRLMQDLDDPKAKARARFKQWRQDSQTSTETPGTKDSEAIQDDEDQSATSDSSSGDDNEDEDDDDDNEKSKRKEDDDDYDEVSEVSEMETEKKDHASPRKRMLETDTETEIETDLETEADEDEPQEPEEEEEELGKDRDDEFAAEIDIKDDDSEAPNAFRIALAPSEIKSFTRIGSDEDDDGIEDEEVSEEETETAVSRSVNADKLMPSDNENSNPTSPSPKESDLSASSPKENGTPEKDGNDNKVIGDDKGEQIVNGEVNGMVEDSDELSIDDLPSKMTGLAKEDVEALEKQMNDEANMNSIQNAVLESMNTGHELAGDSMAIKGPESEAGSIGYDPSDYEGEERDIRIVGHKDVVPPIDYIESDA